MHGLPTKKFVWRNQGDDNYKITEAFEDNPLELSHYLLVRTREHIFLQNKVEEKLAPAKTASGKAYQTIKGNYYEDALKEEGFAFVDISKIWSTPNTQKHSSTPPSGKPAPSSQHLKNKVS